MVHNKPDSNGIVRLERNSGRTGVLIANYDLDNNVTMQVTGNPTITVRPMSQMKIPDSVAMKFTGQNSTQQYAVFDYVAGSEQ
tara:strand:- start:409 stop:657 length:249 start_codon:yes stop_codon:yes gene_type:complete